MKRLQDVYTIVSINMECEHCGVHPVVIHEGLYCNKCGKLVVKENPLVCDKCEKPIGGNRGTTGNYVECKRVFAEGYQTLMGYGEHEWNICFDCWHSLIYPPTNTKVENIPILGVSE